MVVFVALVPLATRQVALTFVTRLATFDGEGGRSATTIAVICWLVVVLVLSAKGRPTSLTLAIVVGGLTGAGLGWGLPVLLLVRGPRAALRRRGARRRRVTRRAERAAIKSTTTRGLWHGTWPRLLETLAYAANDGQKMLAVFMIALGFSGAPLAYTSLVAALFGVGALYGLPKAGRTLSREIIAFRPLHGVSAELSAGTAVLGCSALGMPVSMTQAIAGGLIGSGVNLGGGRVRWYAAVKIVTAWLLTLPASLLLAAVAAFLVKGAGA